MNRLELTDGRMLELRRAGDALDVKITEGFVNGQRCVFIRDFEFTDYVKAVKFLRTIGENEMIDNGLYGG
jgi:hypothetical protein